MVSSLLKGLSEEKVVLLNTSRLAKLPFLLKGIVRLVDGRGNTLGVVLDKKTLEEIEEETESSNPEFIASLETSRRSGRVSAKAIKNKMGME